MTTRLILLLAALLYWAAPVQGQTIKTLGFNTTNGQVVAATNLTFTNAATFADGIAMEPAQDGNGTMTYNGVSGLKFIKPPFVDATTNFFALFPHWDPFSDNPLGWQIGTATNSTNDLTTLFHFASDGIFWAGLGASLGGAIQFRTNTAAAATRTNLGLGLPALTNTSNVTAMRALAGSTNTNQPFSGSISLTNTNTLVFSNGILLSQ